MCYLCYIITYNIYFLRDSVIFLIENNFFAISRYLKNYVLYVIIKHKSYFSYFKKGNMQNTIYIYIYIYNLKLQPLPWKTAMGDMWGPWSQFILLIYMCLIYGFSSFFISLFYFILFYFIFMWPTIVLITKPKDCTFRWMVQKIAIQEAFWTTGPKHIS